MYRLILFFIFSSFIFSASISIDKNLFIKDFENDRYLNTRKGELNKKKFKLNKDTPIKLGHKIKLSINKTYHRNDFSRDSYILMNFECIEGPNTGVELSLTADIEQGEVVVPGWEYNDYVCVIAQHCTVFSCSESVGPVCVYAGSDEQSCVDDSYGCDGQLLGDTNNDGYVNVIDVVTIVNFILDGNLDFEDCNIIASDFNQDQQLDVLDIIEIINLILSGNTFRIERFNTF